MNWDAIGALAELAGAVAVILTLFYLARQVRHAADQSRLSGVQAIQSANDRAYDPIYTPEMASIWHRGHEDREGLPRADQRIFDLLMVRLVASYSSTVFQHERGAYDDELMESATGFLASIISSPGGRSWWQTGQIGLVSPVRKRLDAALASRSE